MIHKDILGLSFDKTPEELTGWKGKGLTKEQVLRKNEYTSNQYLAIDRVHLKGIQFRLFETRWQISNSDLVSFVFIKIPDYPELDGTCVSIVRQLVVVKRKITIFRYHHK